MLWSGAYVIIIEISESAVVQSCPTLCDPWTVAHQSPPSMGFSRQVYWSGLPSVVDFKLKTWTAVHGGDSDASLEQREYWMKSLGKYVSNL